ncbi:MAG: DUF4421 domain-containing protein [Muribaculum sp.]|nr:DUF4421 domain-containing protein [Muribaculum sp.]
MTGIQRFAALAVMTFITVVASFASLPDTSLHKPLPVSPATLAESTAASEPMISDTVRSLNGLHDTRWNEDHWWTNVLRREHKLAMNDTTIHYPKFIGFCVDVYNWGDRFFNSVDPRYVQSTGKRWKIRITSDNWLDSYAMSFPAKMSMRMMNNVYSNFGAYLHYMAVSVGYSINLNHVLFGKPMDRKKLEFGFSCARFNAEFSYTKSDGGNYMRKFGDYNNGRLFKSYFPGLNMQDMQIAAYYFFNNRKYSEGAAYSFGKFQRLSAGSFMAGLSYSDQDINIDFSTLNADLKKYLKLDRYFLKFHYFSYCLLFGYGYNWVWNPHFLFNITAMPSIGVTHCYEDSAEGTGNLLALNIKGRMSITYNLGDFFAGLQAKMDGQWYRSDKYSLFNSIESLTLSAGWRF